MTTTFPQNLIDLTDGDNSVSVRALGPHPTEPGCFDAEIVVRTSFVTGRLWLFLSPRRLAEWRTTLDALAAGHDTTWMEPDSGPSFGIRLWGERECPEVVIEDESLSMVTVTVPIGLEADWLDEQRRLLQAFTETHGTGHG
ncbi:DUF5959 family protein [Streptomyces sp. WAC06614]|uniref:DUF5959 family protein n=1 Tax=Streptomyces sp. WAC06614 TaxID=2487416 RepID=UPI000F79565E|nr:DUF5959 family protein [Streptomyces sp. WAC06614]RSS81479.1 hypothetical protein EF918_10080 [Streptomyces sp. WAC06614]